MTKEQKQVLEFHLKFGLTVNATPTVPSGPDAILRMNLEQEETNELIFAMHNKDLPEIADALADKLYVLLGTAVSYGIDLEPVFQLVHAANMRKLWADGKAVKRADGKIMKPSGWLAPNIVDEIGRQKNGNRYIPQHYNIPHFTQCDVCGCQHCECAHL